MLRLAALFDVLTIILLISGCVLLWLNLPLRKPGVLAADPDRADCEPAEKVDPAAERSAIQLTPTDKSELHADEGADLSDAAPVREANARAEAISMIQNHYASSVSAAIAKSRKASALV